MIGQAETSAVAIQDWQHPVVFGITTAIVIGLLLASILIRVFRRAKRIDEDTYHELLLRVRSWYILSAVMVLPILIGSAGGLVVLFAIGNFLFLGVLKSHGVE